MLNHNLHEKILQKYWKNRYQEALEPIIKSIHHIDKGVVHKNLFIDNGINKYYLYINMCEFSLCSYSLSTGDDLSGVFILGVFDLLGKYENHKNFKKID